MYFILQMVGLCLYIFDQQVNTISNCFNTIAKLVRVSFHLISGSTWVGWNCICAFLISSKLVIDVKDMRIKVSTALNTVLRYESSKIWCCCRLVDRYECFVGTCCLQHLGWKMELEGFFRTFIPIYKTTWSCIPKV